MLACRAVLAGAILFAVATGGPALAQSLPQSFEPPEIAAGSALADRPFKLARLVMRWKNAEPKPRRHIVIVAVGDTGFGSHLAPVLASGGYKHGQFQSWEEALSDIAPEIDGDANFANLETVVTTSNALSPVSKAYNFRTHPDAVRYLVEAGFNLFSTANNHAFDYGPKGIVDTVENLEELAPDAIFAGTGRNRDEAAAARVIRAGASRLALGAIGIGGGIASEGHPGQLAINSKSDVDLLLANLGRAEADYRILSVHSGKERLPVPLGFELARWRDMALSSGDVDMVLMHHTHVARPVAMVGDRVIFFGLGNFAHFGTANMNGAGICRDYSMLVRAHLADDAGGRLKLAAIEIVPIRSTHLRPERLPPAEGRKRIAVLNKLARTVDAPATGATGMRFSPREDGTGLFCTAYGMDGPPEVAALCRDYDADAAAGLEDELGGRANCCLSLSCMGGSGKAIQVSTEAKRKPLRIKRNGPQLPIWLQRDR